MDEKEYAGNPNWAGDDWWHKLVGCGVAKDIMELLLEKLKHISLLELKMVRLKK